MLYNFSLSKLEASRVSVFGSLATVISILAGVIFLKEQLVYYHVVGSILIIGGVVGTNLSPRSRKGMNHAPNDNQRL
jgi:drug/metabolite transporter (DMT)-like permease